jgi:hypothetical protein
LKFYIFVRRDRRLSAEDLLQIGIGIRPDERLPFASDALFLQTLEFTRGIFIHLKTILSFRGKLPAEESLLIYFQLKRDSSLRSE